MIWLILVLLSAISQSLTNALSKKSLETVHVTTSLFFTFLFSMPVYLVVLVFVGLPQFAPSFGGYLLVGLLLEIPAFLFLFKAFALADFSLIAPLAALLPVMSMVSSAILLGEVPPLFGIIGVLLIAVGLYVLRIDHRKNGFFAPLASLVKEKGTRYMLFTMTLWGVITPVHKAGIASSSPVVWVGSLSLGCLVFFGFLSRHRVDVHSAGKHLRILLPMGIANGVTTTLLMFAIPLALVAYTFSLQQLSILLSVWIGWWYFKEKQIGQRFAGSIIMIAGVVCILFA